MSESMKCPYEERCKEVNQGEKMDNFRKQCDCVNCALCDYYWQFYDKRYLERLNGK